MHCIGLIQVSILFTLALCKFYAPFKSFCIGAVQIPKGTVKVLDRFQEVT